MGVDCVIQLPSMVYLNDVADAIGILAGCKAYKENFSSADGWSTRVESVEKKGPEYLPGCAAITFKRNEKERYVLYHFEPSNMLTDEDPGRLLMPPSTAFWIAIGHRLVEIFGGKIFYNDCECDEIPNFENPERQKWVRGSNGDAWYERQEKLLAIKPLTEEEIESYTDYAAYGNVNN